VPGPGNLVAAPSDTGHADAGPAGGYYKLAAIDAHGNRSPFVLLTPQQTLDAPGAASAGLYLAAPSPNPASGLATFRFGLPSGGRVRLELFDAHGRRVRGLVGGERDAGEHLVRWDGTDDAGSPAPSGLYFARLLSGHESRTVRLLRVR